MQLKPRSPAHWTNSCLRRVISDPPEKEATRPPGWRVEAITNDSNARPMTHGVLVEVKVFIDVFKLCTFSTDQIKEFVGEVYLCIVGRDMDG